LENLVLHEEIVLDPQGPLGIHADHTYSVQGVSKREIRVGLGLPGWGGDSFNYPRYVLSEFTAALACIDSDLAPTLDDILIGFVEPVHFYKNWLGTNTYFLDPHVSSAPRDISGFPGLKILQIGDTHHGLLTLSNALAYCQSEPWDAFLLCHQSAHIDWFRAVLGKNRVFLYHFLVPQDKLCCRELASRHFSDRPYQSLTFHGEFSHLHPRRSFIFNSLFVDQNHDGYRHVGRLPTDEWIRSLPDSAALLSVCLNNQISVGHLYAMFSGCLLFSDKFHDSNGWGKLFRDGESYVLYESLDDLIELFAYYVNRPDSASKIAQKGRQLCEQHFLLGNYSRSWLLAPCVDELVCDLESSTKLLENSSSTPIQWASSQSLEVDLAVFEILQDLCVCFPAVLLITPATVFPSLVRSAIEQLARCFVSPLLMKADLSAFPVVMTRLPHRFELMNLLYSKAAYILVLLPSDNFDGSEPPTTFEELLDGLDTLIWRPLGDSLHRKDLGILHVSPMTAHAQWPLPSGWQAHLIYSNDAFSQLIPLYPQFPHFIH
jgi:hypothetical protein